MQLKIISSSLLMLVVFLCDFGFANARLKLKAKIYKLNNSDNHWKSFKRTHFKTYRNASHEAKRYKHWHESKYIHSYFHKLF